jgi:uncharacterized membrane protein HdeD (DUF308 family)
MMTNDDREVEVMALGMVTRNRKRLMAYGILAIIFGLIGVYMSTAMTITSILVMGIFLLIIGILSIVESFSAPKWDGKLINLGLSMLYIIAGAVTIYNPIASAVWFTLFLSIFLGVMGVFRLVMSFQIRDESSAWIWVALGGISNIILSILIYLEWPESGLWVIGLFISIELIIQGVNAISLSSIIKDTEDEVLENR